MGREVRKVPADWQHPKNEHGRFVALFDGGDYESRVKEWDEGAEKWARGEFPDYAREKDKKLTYEEWDGERPDANEYMPRWTEAEATHYMMYETCSEGTPISPAFATPEELARWLADTGASSFGSQTSSYEAWLRVARGGFAPTAVLTLANGLRSGVEGIVD